MKIEPTETVRNAATDAVIIQNACNPVAVMQAHREHLISLGREGLGTDEIARHPVNLAFLDKLCSLARVQSFHDKIDRAHQACLDLADGKAVEWDFE